MVHVNKISKKIKTISLQTHAHSVEDKNVFLAMRGVDAKVDVLFVDILEARHVLAPFQQGQRCLTFACAAAYRR